ncbi:hypothetical protein CLOM_g3509 [Closterium sp. NIES-68]|nr:hypothetical protein CLOM_g3509 [Closterium sp. NIES-68]GJP75242.1 hypothetical protein CLOP_g5700 [Closterium sp. NIES-67]
MMTSLPTLDTLSSAPPFLLDFRNLGDFLPWLLESCAAVSLAFSQLPPLVWGLLIAGIAAVLLAFLYSWFDLHVVSHVFVGDRVKVVHHPGSNVARAVFARMRIPHFWPTPWLCSPHLQTTFVHFFARTPRVPYIRQVVRTPDGGTLALDWAEPAAEASKVSPGVAAAGGKGGGQGGEGRQQGAGGRAEGASEVPIVIVVPGLTSASDDKYMRHCVAGVTRHGWRALVPNHRGLGGVTITSSRFYNAGWTTDLRFVIGLVKRNYPLAPLYAIGTSLGANILVKYLGEEGASGPIQAAVSIGNPWDLLICDRWMSRRTRQRVYNMAMATGLREFAKLHKDSFQHLVDVQHVMKARTIRQFDDRITRIVSNYETVDTYYRRCSSAQFLPEVAVPLLAVSSLDDPICTKEAIPWDEAKGNPNVVLAVSHHGGHLAYLQGLTASSIWWVQVSLDFLQAVVDARKAGELVGHVLPISSAATALPPHPHPHVMEPSPFLTSTPSFRSVAALGTLPPPSSSSPLSPSQTSLARRRTSSSLGNISEEGAQEERPGAPSLTGRGGKRGGPIGVFSIEGEEGEECGKNESGSGGTVAAAAAAAAAADGAACSGGLERRVAGASGLVGGTGRTAGGEAERGEGRGKVHWVKGEEEGRVEGEGEGEEEEEEEEEGMSTVSMSVLAGTIDGRESVTDEDEGKEGEVEEVGSGVGEGGREDDWEMGPAGGMCGEDDLGEVVSGTGQNRLSSGSGVERTGRITGVGRGGAGGTVEGKGGGAGGGVAGGPVAAAAVVQIRFESEEQLRVAAVVVRELMSKIQRCLDTSPAARQAALSPRRETAPMNHHKPEDSEQAAYTHHNSTNHHHQNHLPHQHLHQHPPTTPSPAPSTHLFAAAASPSWRLAYLALAVACPLVASAVALRLYRHRATAGGSGSLGLVRLASALAKK